MEPSLKPFESDESDRPFSEVPAWSTVGKGWRPLFGNYRDLGFSFEWHDFTGPEDFEWARTFHPGSVEICFNLDGQAVLSDGRRSIDILPRMFIFYYQGTPPLTALRRANQPHRFVTVELSPVFLEEHFRKQADNLHPLVRAVALRQAQDSGSSLPQPISILLLHLVESLRHCPVFRPAQEAWFRAKALEVVAQLLFSPPKGEFLCTRTQRVAQVRVERVRAVLQSQMQNPPSLEELGRQVGCSPFYLSRQFSSVTGMTTQQFIRQVRLERAAELLRTGKCNVTEAAFEVGYNSLSHFTTAFRERFGCCPGLYPMRSSTSDR